MAKNKTKWIREGADNYETLYLVPSDRAADADDGDAPFADDCIAYITPAYDRTRFYGGIGGEGTSRPDGYVATLVVGGRNIELVNTVNVYIAHIGGIFSTRSSSGYRTITEAKTAIKAALAARAVTPTVAS